MSDHIPFEIQAEIMRRLPVKSVIRFRAVSKAWKSLIDSHDFMKHYNSQQQHLLVRYDRESRFDEPDYVSIVDDDTFPGQIVSPTIPSLVYDLKHEIVIGSSHGLLCLYGLYGDVECFHIEIIVLWNISIRKAVYVNVDVPNGNFRTILGFGVCDETCDPKIVKITYIDRWKDFESISCIPSQVEVFTLSTGAWRNPYSNNLPRKSIDFFYGAGQAVDGFLYWLATDRSTMDDGIRAYNLIILFDITSEEFSEINLPDALVHGQLYYELSISNRRESLVVLQRCGKYVNDYVFHVWMMEDGVPKSFTKIFTICTPGIISVPGFRKSGEPVIRSNNDFRVSHNNNNSSLAVYEPQSKHITKLRVRECYWCSISLYSYMETLLLLNQPNQPHSLPLENYDFEGGEQELNF